MQLFYTGALAPEDIQLDSAKSLGGYKSSTLISNGRLNNLFPTITKSDVVNNYKSIRMIVLKNTTSSTVNNLSIWTSSQIYSKLKIAAVEPALDIKCNIQYFESVEDNSLPFQATLQSHEGQINKLVIGSLASQAMVGIWLQRELDVEKFTESNLNSAQVDCEACITFLQNQETNTNIDPIEDVIEVFVDWN